VSEQEQSDFGHTLPHSISSVYALPKLLFVVDREGGNASERRIEIDGDRIRIGSHPSNEIVIDDRMVSRFHCTLTLGRAAWSITDSGSKNGTYVSGVRIREAILPSKECELRVGNSLLRVAPLGTANLVRISELSRFGGLYGASAAMRRVYDVLERVAASDTTILIQGESGTGKELVAHEIVQRGARARRPFLTIDCSAISPALIESELFGHARGAFTGADRLRIGAFEAAHGGTVFLDEIGEMPLDMQPKLLRALESREIRRAGENEARKVDVRVIAATNRNLESEVNRGRFREDLYFRLSVISVCLPPLRERLEDIPIIVRAFLEDMEAVDADALFSSDVFRELARHDWPGNVRELRNYVERVLVLQDSGAISSRASVDDERDARGDASASIGADIEEPFKTGKERVISRYEQAYLEKLMAWAGGNVSRAARRAKIDRMYLHRLLQRYAIKRDSQSDE
jgi:DNA-binding NtrC family response regulator